MARKRSAQMDMFAEPEKPADPKKRPKAATLCPTCGHLTDCARMEAHLPCAPSAAFNKAWCNCEGVDPLAEFDGETYEPEHDKGRLGAQLDSVRRLMADAAWRTLDEISAAVGAPPASVSARLRDLRKEKFGGHVVERQARGGRAAGLFEYRVTGGTHA
jgi:hypothetical protein